MSNIVEFPNKFFFTIGDVSRMTKIKPHILRYWESQFKLLRPARRYSGHRKYTQREVDLINKISYLVIDKRFTLSGAKKELNRQTTAQKKTQNYPSAITPGSSHILQDIKKDIENCLSILGHTIKEEIYLK